MTRIAEIADRLRRLAKRREMEGIYTDSGLCEEAAAILAAIGADGQAVAWRISCPDDEIYGRGPDTVRFHPLSPDEIASGYMQQPLYTHPAHSGQAVADTWFTDRALPVKAMSGDIEDNRVLRLHFRRPVTDDDRKAMCDALNLHQASLAHPQPLPLKDEVERVLDRIADEYGIPGPWDEKFKTAQSLARALLTRLRAGEQEGWRDISIAPKDGTKVVLAEWDTWNECWRFGVSWWRKYLNEGEGFGWVGHKPTHWQPLPASPSVSDGGSRNG